jgi:hypothetical protein
MRPGEPHADLLARRTEVLAHPQRHAQHHAARRQRVARHPVDELALLGLERRDLELVLDVLKTIVQARPHRDVVRPDHAGCSARAERHADQIARRQLHPGRDPVGIGLIERDRHQDIDDALRHGEGLADSAQLRKGEESR